MLNEQTKKLQTKTFRKWQTLKRPYLRIIGIEERAETQIKCTENIFNKFIGENFPNLKKGDDYEGTKSMQNTE